MNKKRNWAIALILSAMAGIFALQNISAPASHDLQAETFTPTSTEAPTPTFTPTYEGCSFMWAYHDEPQLSAKIDEAIRTLDPAASANAQLYGEDCVYADGHSTFSTMETDFYVRLPVDDLTADEAFGNWIKQVMDYIVILPDDEIQGRKGFVEFVFIKSDTEQIVIRVGINDYLTNANEATGLELLQIFYVSPPLPTTPVPITATLTP